MSLLFESDKDKLIEQMSDCLIFALNHYKYNGECVNPDGKGPITPLRWFANTLKLAGVVYDDEDITALQLGAKERRKYFDNKYKKQQTKERVGNES